jgi:uncharacterized protein
MLPVALLLVSACSGGEATSRDDARPSSDEQAGAAERAFEQGQGQAICAERDPQSCYFEGMRLEAESKPQRARRYFEVACDKGHMSSCYDLAVLYEHGQGMPTDPERAHELYERACTADEADAVACNNLAVLYAEGRTVEQDDARAAELYGRSCELGSMLGCRNLARLHLQGANVEQSAERAAELLDEACQKGHPEACPQLTYLHANGCLEGAECDKSAIDPDASADALRDGCEDDGDPQACLGHGFMVESGYGGGEADPAKAALHYAKACEADLWAGCNYLANLYRRGAGVERDAERSVQLYSQACDEGFSLSCHTLGVMYLRGRALEPDPASGYEYIQRACDHGRSPSCTSLDFQCYIGERAACRN